MNNKYPYRFQASTPILYQVSYVIFHISVILKVLSCLVMIIMQTDCETIVAAILDASVYEPLVTTFFIRTIAIGIVKRV